MRRKREREREVVAKRRVKMKLSKGSKQEEEANWETLGKQNHLWWWERRFTRREYSQSYEYFRFF